jgi:hypothetical protein
MGKYFYRYSIFFLVILVITFVSQGQQQQPPYRTQGGYIRAHSVLSLQATATQSGRALATTPIHNIKVAQFAQVLIEQESGNLLIVKDTGWMSYLLTNKGNGEDFFDNFMDRYEGPSGAVRWLVDLYEQRSPNALYEQATRIPSGRTLQFDADDTRRYFVKLRPPGDGLTDGLQLSMNCRSVFASSVGSQWSYLVGAEGMISFTSRMGVPLGNYIPVPPTVHQDRLYWMVNNPTLNRTLLYMTPNPLTVSTPFQGNTLQVGFINGMQLGSQGARSGMYWYMLQNNGNLIRIDLSAPTGVVWTPITLPPEVRIRTEFPLLADDRYLFFLDQSGMLNLLQVANNAIVRVPISFGGISITSFSLAGPNIIVTLQNGTVFILNRTSLNIRTLTIPQPNSQINYAPAYDHFRGNLTIVSGSRLYILNDRTFSWLWMYDAQQPIVGAPIYVPESDAFFFVTDDRRIWSINASTAQLIYPYPQALFDSGQIVNAMLTYVTPKEKKVPYVYLTAMVNEGGGVTRPRLAMVTAWNPLNRVYDSSIPSDSIPRDPMLTSIPSVQGLLLVWFPNILSTDRGWVYGFQLR